MTLGKKLSNYRKVAGLTQQQLAEHLNISAQAISKWENDLSEPDLATLKVLAKLYNTSVDSLLDVDGATPQPQMIDAETVANSVYEKIGEQIKNETPTQPLGFCKNCGITVTEETVAETEPIILCKKCKERLAEEKAAKEKAEKEAEEKRRRDLIIEREKAEKQKENLKKSQMGEMRWHRKKSLIWALVIGILALGISIFVVASGDGDFFNELADSYIGIIVFVYGAFSFTFGMFYDTFIRDSFINMLGTSIKWPGLIFTFDLDGILWLIGMKILFAVLGFLIGLIAAVLGFLFAFFMSMICFPFILLNYSRKIAFVIYEDPELESIL